MVVSGPKNNKRRHGMLSGSNSGSNPVSSQTRHQCQFERTYVRMAKQGENGCSSTRERNWRQKRVPHSDNKEQNSSTQTRTNQGPVRRRNSLSVRSGSGAGLAEEGSRDEFSGKRTIVRWLVDSGVVPLDARVFYMNMACTRALLQGRITKDGLLLCSCCHRTLTVSEFEVHAGSRLCDPYRNIFLEAGINLLKCQINAWEKQGESERRETHIVERRANDSDQNDDTCGICGDGGILMCCDACPSTFHQNCLGIQILPKGDWRCPNCRCRDCGDVSFPEAPLLTCRQCEKRYHQEGFQGCVQGLAGRSIDPKGVSFCEQSCKKLFEQLQDLVGVKKDLGGGYSCYLNQRLDQVSKENLFRQTTRVTCKSKLAVTLAVMEECFDPIVDPRTGVDMMRSVIYNCSSNLNRLNYSGFFAVTLERGDEIISAASIRIHGTKLVEMPFIGTRNLYRCQGMCRRLLHAIESILHFLGIQKLIIPSIHERVEKWEKGYHFMPIEGTLKQEMRSMNLLMFPDTVLLQKTPMDGYSEKQMNS